MHLNEQLKICLLALACRYPKSVIEIDEMVLGHHVCQIDAFAPELELEWLQVYAPQLVQSPAYLVIDPQQSAVYLLELSRDTPAFWIYCDGCSPAQRKKNIIPACEKVASVHKVRYAPCDYVLFASLRCIAGIGE